MREGMINWFTTCKELQQNNAKTVHIALSGQYSKYFIPEHNRNDLAVRRDAKKNNDKKKKKIDVTKNQKCI